MKIRAEQAWGNRKRSPRIAYLNTRNPRRVILHDRSSFALPAREGRGDYRGGEEHLLFRPLRNDVPEIPPYAWRQDGWIDRLARSPVDLRAVLDAETEAPWPDWRPPRDQGRSRYALREDRELREELEFIADAIDARRSRHAGLLAGSVTP